MKPIEKRHSEDREINGCNHSAGRAEWSICRQVFHTHLSKATTVVLATILFLIFGSAAMNSTAQIAKIGGSWKTTHCVSPTMSAVREFTNESTGNIPTSTHWRVMNPSGNEEFNDQNAGLNSPQILPLTDVGVYTVIMCVEWGYTTKCDTAYITTYTVPQFSINKNKDSICSGEDVSFSYTMHPPTDSVKIASVFWDFGDGGNHNPTHIFHNPLNIEQSYYMSLIITDMNGCSSRAFDSVFVGRKPITYYSASICQNNTSYSDGNFTNLTTTGTYYDTLQTVNGCDSIIELTLTITGVGIVEKDNYPSLRVYPNPTTGELIVEIAGQAHNDVQGIEIYNMVGQLLLSYPSLQSLQTIDISHLVNGIYFLKVNNKVTKIIKQ